MAVWNIYQVDNTQFEDGAVRVHSSYGYKQQGLDTLKSMLEYAANSEKANEVQPTKVSDIQWHLYIENRKRSFILLRETKKYLPTIEARDRHLFKW